MLCSLIFKSSENRNPVFLISLLNTYVRPILDCSSPIRFPHLLIDISFTERSQLSFTKRILAIRNITYSDHLLYLNNKSLQHRRLYCNVRNNFVQLSSNLYVKIAIIKS